MKFSPVFVVAFLASVAYSQTIAQLTAEIPSCAISCIENAITGVGCGIADTACQCGAEMVAISQVAIPCILKACSTADALTTSNVTTEICMIEASQPGNSSSSVSVPAATLSSSISSPVASTVSSSTSRTSTLANSSVSSSVSRTSTSATGSTSSTASKASTTTTGSATGSGALASPTGGAGRLDAAGVIGVAALIAAFAL